MAKLCERPRTGAKCPMFENLDVVSMENVQSGRIMGMLQTIRTFIIDNYLFGEGDKLGNEDSFMETGIIDSTGILELVRFLESTYGITVADEELIPDNLDSINKIVSFIYAKQPASISAGGTSFHSMERPTV